MDWLFGWRNGRKVNADGKINIDNTRTKTGYALYYSIKSRLQVSMVFEKDFIKGISGK